MAESSQEVLLGKLALSAGLITEQQLNDCWETQRQLRAQGTARSLAQLLVEKGYATQTQLVTLAKNAAREIQQVTAQHTPNPTANTASAAMQHSQATATATATPPAQTAQTAQTSPIEGYEIISKLGAGAMGAVYKARQVSMDRIVALKVLPPKLAKNQQYIDRFLREARAAAKLNHENIVGAFDIGESNGLYYFAMEYVEGYTAKDLLQEKKALPEREALDIVKMIAKALTHAAKQGIVHRDIKPDNIMITKDGVAKLCDMGLAKQTATDPTITVTGAAVGTPWYISPEQARGERLIDTRADIYSLGCTLFHMVCGGPPYIGPTAAVIMTKHINDPIPDPRRSKSYLSEGVVTIVHKMMAKKANDRYETPEQVIEDIDALLAGKDLIHGNRSASTTAADTGRSSTRGGAASAPVSGVRTAGGGNHRPTVGSKSDRPAVRKGKPRETGTVSAAAASPPTNSASGASKRARPATIAPPPLPSSGTTTVTPAAVAGKPRARRDGGKSNRMLVVVVLIVFLGLAIAAVAVAYRTLNSSGGDPSATPVPDATITMFDDTPNPFADTTPNPSDPSASPEATDGDRDRVRRMADGMMQRAQQAVDEQRYEAALELYEDVAAHAEIRRLAPDVAATASERFVAVRQTAEAAATAAIARIGQEIEAAGLLSGSTANFREATSRYDVFPANLRFTDNAQTGVAAAKSAVRTAAQAEMAEITKTVRGYIDGQNFARARTELDWARRIMLDEFHPEIDRLMAAIVDGQTAARARAEQFRAAAPSKYREFWVELEMLLVTRRLRDALRRIDESLENPELVAAEEVETALRKDRDLVQQLQRFVRATLQQLRQHAGGSEPFRFGGDRRDMMLLGMDEIRDSSQPAIDGPDFDLRLASRSFSGIRRFSTLQGDEMFWLGKAHLDRHEPAAATQRQLLGGFLAFSEGVKDQGEAALDLLTTSRQNGEIGAMHWRVVERLTTQADSFIATKYAEAEDLFSRTQRGAETARRRAQQQFIAAARKLLENAEHSPYLRDNDAARAKQLQEWLASVEAAAPARDVVEWAKIFHGSRFRHHANTNRVEVDYDFREESQFDKDFKLGANSAGTATWDRSARGVILDAPVDPPPGSQVKLEWTAQTKGAFKLEVEIEVQTATLIGVAVCEKSADEQYFIPIRGEAPMNDQIPQQGRQFFEAIRKFPFGLYVGEWKLLGFVRDGRRPTRADFQNPQNLRNESVGEATGFVLPENSLAKLEIIRDDRGRWTITLNGNQRVRPTDLRFENGRISIQLVNGRVVLRSFKFDGNLDPDWLRDAQTTE